MQPKLIVVMGERSVAFVDDVAFPLSDRLDASTSGVDPALHADDPGTRHAGHRRGARRDAVEDRFLERLQGARPLVGGAASLLSSRRAAALAVLLVVLIAYGAGARHLPELPSGLDVPFYAFVGSPRVRRRDLARPPPGQSRHSSSRDPRGRSRRARAHALPRRPRLRGQHLEARLLHARRLHVPLALRGAVVADPRRGARAVGRHLVGRSGSDRVRRRGANGALRRRRGRVSEPRRKRRGEPRTARRPLLRALPRRGGSLPAPRRGRHGSR